MNAENDIMLPGAPAVVLQRMVGASGLRLPKSGEEWASKETGLTVKIMKADDDVVWWENSEIWSFPSQTTLPEFLHAMKLTGRTPPRNDHLETDGRDSSEGVSGASVRCSNADLSVSAREKSKP